MLSLKQIKPGQPIRASFLNTMLDLLAARLIGGAGINIEKRACGIVISASSNGTRSGVSWQPYSGD